LLGSHTAFVELREETQIWGKVANFDASTFFLETSDSFDYVQLIIGIVSGVLGMSVIVFFACIVGCLSLYYLLD